ncbi:MAG: hypothetical protein AAGN82_17860 [Myxococcota bacterium]
MTWRRRALRLGGSAAMAAVVTATVPAAICRSGADEWRTDDPAAQLALAAGVSHWTERELEAASFTTGDALFDAEWLFGTYMMAAMGYGQLAAQRPEGDPVRAQMLTRMDHCLGRLGEPDVAAFDTGKWGRAALDDLDGDAGHAAYLGYYGLALTFRSGLGAHPLASRAEAVADALARRLAQEDVIETYPGERYPVDNAAGVAAVALKAQNRHHARPHVVARWLEVMDERFVDPTSGLLVQSVRADGTRLDVPRGSGTALASYFLSFVDAARSRALYEAAMASLGDRVLGFGALREYPDGGRTGDGDIDSGPLIAGFSIAATGFALAGAKRFGDEATFASLWATARLFGAPRRRDNALHFATGGPLGDAILFAMLTARRDEDP